MKISVILLIFLQLEIANAFGSSYFNKGIYGDDNRRMMSEATKEEQNWGKSVLAQVPTYKILRSDESTITFNVETPQKALNLCAEEKFANETMLSSCSGFLVSPEILVTAWHCLKDKVDCKKNLWLLDYNESQSVFSKKQIVYCKEIIDSKASADYALVRLSKPILDRKPLKLRRSGRINKEANLTVIGHPLGLPKIATDQAYLNRNVLNNTFTILSDTYSGNSGSPVIDTKTSLVEGMLIKGDRDLEMDYSSQCYRSVHCDDQWCLGETILRSVLIPILH